MASKEDFKTTKAHWYVWRLLVNQDKKFFEGIIEQKFTDKSLDQKQGLSQ